MVYIRKYPKLIYWKWKDEDSNDSGRGASEIQFEQFVYPESNLLSYEFEIAHEFVGRLIGRNGKHVNFIKRETNTDISVINHPGSDENKVCCLTGTSDGIQAALKLIRKKFPAEKFPSITLAQICFLPYTSCPEYLMMRLPEGSWIDVTVSSVINVGHFFLQQPTHPAFYSLAALRNDMTKSYNEDRTAPSLSQVQKGDICVAPVGLYWYRVSVEEVYDTDECKIKLLDYGGYHVLPCTTLKQINCHFMYLPFQSVECYLAYVTFPEGETEWSNAATELFNDLSDKVVLHAIVVDYATDGIPFVQLYRNEGSKMIDFSTELIKRHLARPIKADPSKPAEGSAEETQPKQSF